MKSPTPINPKNSATRENEPGLTEFSVLLNQFADPVILVDVEFQEILLPNSELLKLTAFSRNELIGKSILNLFTEGLPETSAYGEEFSVVFKETQSQIGKHAGKHDFAGYQ